MNILLIEDHKMMIDGYLGIINRLRPEWRIDFKICQSCKSAYDLLIKRSFNAELAIVDFNVPTYEEGKLFNGKDVAILIKNLNPKCKIIIATTNSDILTLYSIYHEIHPEGILVKSDFDSSEFIDTVENVYNGKRIYSESAMYAIAAITSERAYFDLYNRQILFLLGQGIKTKNLPFYLNLSLSAIDKRKALIKDYFGVIGDDDDMIQIARKKGFI